MSADDVELRRLRERVYGGTGDPPTPDEIARLGALEDVLRRDAVRAPHAPASKAPSPAVPAPAGPVLAATDEGDRPEERDADLHRPRVFSLIVGVVASLALLGAGYAAGVASPAFVAASATPSPSASPRFPELTFPQTDDDVITAQLIDDSGIDPATTRYIAVVRGFRVYLAKRERGEGSCVVTFVDADDEPWAAGCTTGGPFDDAAVFGVDQHLSIAIGDTSRMTITGTPVRLSESVTAYITE